MDADAGAALPVAQHCLTQSLRLDVFRGGDGLQLPQLLQIAKVDRLGLHGQMHHACMHACNMHGSLTWIQSTHMC